MLIALFNHTQDNGDFFPEPDHMIPAVVCVCALQNADPVKRQRGFHVEREEPWEHTFNFSIVLQPAVLLFADWCTSDVSAVTLSSSSLS